MIYHVLPGDAQVKDFRATGLQGEMLVCREALIDGDVSGETLDEFFINRAVFVNQTHGEDPSVYNANVASEFRRLLDVNDGDEINLWFEYELFCAVNMWFCLSLLRDSGAEIYRVAPTHLGQEDRWDGFGNANAQILEECFQHRTKLESSDVQLGSKLWKAFQLRDNDEILSLISEKRATFPYLDEVGRAAIEIETTPRAVVQQLGVEGITNFGEFFIQFRERAGVYGFGDAQVQQLIDRNPRS